MGSDAVLTGRDSVPTGGDSVLTGPVRPPARPPSGAGGPIRSRPWAWLGLPGPTSSTPPGSGAATVALTVVTITSAAGLLRVFTGHSWIAPLLLTAVGVHATCFAARRLRVPQTVALLAGVVAVWALAAWTVLPGSTAYGFPGRHTASELWTALVQAHNDFASAISPVSAGITGFKLVAVLAVGLVAILGDSAAFRWRSALYGAAPAFAYFVACCAFGQGPGREWIVTAEVVALLAFLLVHRVTVARADQAWFGNQRAGTAGWAITAGCLIAAAALITTVAVTPALGSTEGTGVLGWRHGIGGDDSGTRQVANPVVDLHTRLLIDSTSPVFKVESPVPSYWRLTSLDTFTGQDWVSTDTYRGFGSRLPGTQAVPPGTRIVEEDFQIQQLESVWLPDAFTPSSVIGVRNVSYDPTSNSLITAKATSDGLNYTVDSYQYLSTLDPGDLESAPPVAITSSLRRDLQLPSSVPPDVYALAKTITAGQTTEYGKALALQNYFRGPDYSYTLDPPVDGFGINSLVDFLFDTRQGYCQQFAGSYAVLARAIGLPTRLAVGFATGSDIGDGRYQVLDADAHTWPEVYFGPGYGWLPFEPTPSFANPMSQGYAPPPSGEGSGPDGSSASALPKPNPATGSNKQGLKGRTGRVTPTTVGAQITLTASRGGISAVWLALIIAIGAVIAWAGLVVGGRRAGWSLRKWRARGSPRSLVLASWAEVDEVLNWWGACRHSGETDAEYGARAGRLLARRLPGPSPWLTDEIHVLAGLATEAVFAAQLSPQAASDAGVSARQIHRYLWRAAPTRQRLRWVLAPRPGRRGASTNDTAGVGSGGPHLGAVASRLG